MPERPRVTVNNRGFPQSLPYEEQELLRKGPVAYDRHFKLPIYNAIDLGPYRVGEFNQYNLDNPEGQRLARGMGTEKYIQISPNVKQSYKWNEENEWNPTIKHELVHALESELRPKGQSISPRNYVPAPSLKDFFTRSYRAPAYLDKLTDIIGPQEVNAYLMSNTVQGNKDLPYEPELVDVLQEQMLQNLQDMGLGRYAPIWKRRR